MRRLRALPEPAMRCQVVVEQWLESDAAGVFAFLKQLAEQMGRRNREVLIGLSAVHAAILQGQAEGPLYELLAEVYRLAREADERAVMAMLLIAKPQRGPVSETELPADRELGRLTLGERKFLARGRDRLRLDRLLLDPHPAVIRNLLLNPHLTERDVVRIASRRPARDMIQREIAASRFSNRYRVRQALVHNPYTPTDLSLKLVGFLLRKDLTRVAEDATLHPLVREEAKRLLATHRRGRRRRRSVSPDD